MIFRGQNAAQAVKVLHGGHTSIDRIYHGAAKIWDRPAAHVPTITAFTAVPDAIDLDVRPNGNITLAWTVEGAESVRLTRHSDHADVPIPGGASTVDVLQPDRPETYTLTATNDRGSVSRAVQIAVTENPRIEDFQVDRYLTSPGITPGATAYFSGNVYGVPFPTVDLDQGIGRVSARHFEGGEHFEISHHFAPGNRNVTATVTNSSGTVTATVAVQT